ncbi:MAG: PilZ domain-containing protein [Myxococcales bacterium]|nr:PilZ domain-containing protein [Myxococcales bacterium]
MTTARGSRESLAKGLNALQADPNIPPQLLEVAAPIAQAMGALHQIEKSNGTTLMPHAETALSSVRAALAQLQGQPQSHPAVLAAMDAVAQSLGQVHALHKMATGPATAATQVAPPQAAPQAPPPQAAPQAPPPQAAPPQAAPPQAPPPQAAPMGGPSPMAGTVAAVPRNTSPIQVPPQGAPAQPGFPPPQAQQPPMQHHASQPQMQPPMQQPPMQQPPMQQPPMQHHASQPQMQPPQMQQPHMQQPPMQRPSGPGPAMAYAPTALGGQAADPFRQPGPPAQQPPQPVGGPPGGHDPFRTPADVGLFNADLGAHSATNFYKGLSGNDIIDHGGLFVSTYMVPKMGSQVRLKVSLPGGYEFEANAVVRWVREASEAGNDAPPGFGAQFTQITQEARQLVYRYVRNREPIFHDDM